MTFHHGFIRFHLLTLTIIPVLHLIISMAYIQDVIQWIQATSEATHLQGRIIDNIFLLCFCVIFLYLNPQHNIELVKVGEFKV